MFILIMFEISRKSRQVINTIITGQSVNMGNIDLSLASSVYTSSAVNMRSIYSSPNQLLLYNYKCRFFPSPQSEINSKKTFTISQCARVQCLKYYESIGYKHSTYCLMRMPILSFPQSKIKSKKIFTMSLCACVVRVQNIVKVSAIKSRYSVFGSCPEWGLTWTLVIAFFR